VIRRTQTNFGAARLGAAGMRLIKGNKNGARHDREENAKKRRLNRIIHVIFVREGTGQWVMDLK
jgi:hypothetical protein